MSSESGPWDIKYFYYATHKTFILRPTFYIYRIVLLWQQTGRVKERERKVFLNLFYVVFNGAEGMKRDETTMRHLIIIVAHYSWNGLDTQLQFNNTTYLILIMAPQTKATEASPVNEERERRDSWVLRLFQPILHQSALLCRRHRKQISLA